MTNRSGFEIETSVDIARSTVDVFAFLASTRSFKAVDPALVEFEPEGDLRPGLTGTFLHRRGGLPARSTWLVVESDPPRRLAVEIRGMGYGMTEEAMLKPQGDGTRATFVDRVWPTSLPGRLLVALSGRIMRRDLRARSERLRKILEAGAPPAA